LDTSNFKSILVYSCHLDYCNGDNYEEDNILYFNSSNDLHKFMNNYNKRHTYEKYLITSDGDLYYNLDDIFNLIKEDIENELYSDKYIIEKYHEIKIYYYENNILITGIIDMKYQQTLKEDLNINYWVDGFNKLHRLFIDNEEKEEYLYNDNFNNFNLFDDDNNEINNYSEPIYTIYFIQSENDGAIKIGITKDIKKRLKALQTSNPYKLNLLYSINGGKSLEDNLHNKFKQYRLNGEWFEPAQEILDYIEELKNKDIIDK